MQGAWLKACRPPVEAVQRRRGRAVTLPLRGGAKTHAQDPHLP